MHSQKTHTEVWTLVRGPFLYPQNFPGHTCEWETLASCQAGCVLCGRQHACKSNSECVESEDDNGQIVCTITGCIIRETEMRTEWGAMSRTHMPESEQKRTQVVQANSAKNTCPCDTWLFVHNIIKSILNSKTTEKCRQQENIRLYTTQIGAMQKAIKKQKETQKYVNMVRVAATVAFHTRKLRRPAVLPAAKLEELITTCTNTVCRVMLLYHNQHTSKLLNSEVRRREFVCSMLYLMRTGVSCSGQCILPQISIISLILPLETFLPEQFNIRAKSITEGENMLKIEIRRKHCM